MTGGGWLATLAGQKLNIGFNAHDKGAGGLHGNLQLNDKTAGVKIHLTDLTYIGEVGANCGAISAAANAVEFQGDGAYNGAPAAFRVCVVDGDEPGGDGQDRFYLECVSGCGYSTSARVADNGLDGGNIKLHQAPGSSGAAVRDGGTLTAAKGAGLAFVQNAPAASVLILNPLLMTDGVIGLSEDFTVEAYDVAGAPLAGVAVTLVATAADGSTQTLTTFSGADGLALFTVAHLSGETEYIAYDGALSSNAIAVTGLLP